MKRKLFTLTLLVLALFSSQNRIANFDSAQSSVSSAVSTDPTSTSQNTTSPPPPQETITKDTTWTKADSPYNARGLIIRPNATLTVEPGVTINLSNEFETAVLSVYGNLRALGTASDPIHLNVEGGGVWFRTSNITYNEETDSGSIIENAVINITKGGLWAIELDESASPKIDRCLIVNNSPANTSRFNQTEGIRVIGGRAIVSNNRFYSYAGIVTANDAITNTTCNAQIINNTISGVNTAISIHSGGILAEGTIVIRGNIITDNEVGVTGGNLIIDNEVGPIGGNLIMEGNLIARNKYGVGGFSGSSLVINNTIVYNYVGIEGPISSSSSVVYNNIMNNTEVNVDFTKHSTSGSNMTYNWWGTTNETEITQTIRDRSFYGYSGKYPVGIATFVPFLTEPNLEAPAISELPPLPSTSSSPNPPSPSVPDFPPWVILALAATAVLLAVLLLRRRIRVRQPSEKVVNPSV
jgi:hypothetical protein